MKKKIKLFSIILIMCPIFLSTVSQSQTAGTLTCSFTTVSTGGFSPKNVLAAWIETNSGVFIKTKLKYCSSSNLDHLDTWVIKSGENVVDAITGNTRTANGPLTFVWNGTNVSSAIVADGIYKVWIEFAWASSLTTGKTVEPFSFTKGLGSDIQTLPNSANLTDITLSWVPAGLGIAEKYETDIFSISPNPVTNQSVINYSLNDLSDITISMYDVTGKLVNVLFDGNQHAGKYSIPLLLKGKTVPGIYYLKMYTGKNVKTTRVLIRE